MTTLNLTNPAIPQGSHIVVTGVTGFIGSHVANQLLLAGYKVRGTTRDTQRGVWIEKLFKGEYGEKAFELCEVKDMAVEEAFDGVTKGELFPSTLPDSSDHYVGISLPASPRGRIEGEL